MQELITYTQDAPLEVPADRIAGWMLIARGKLKMESVLNGHKMVIEKLLSDVARKVGNGPVSLETEIAEFRRIQTAMVVDRKKFTSVLDFIKDGTMAIEKEFDPKFNVQLNKMEVIHLEWKKVESARQQQEENKQREVAALKAHVENQYQIMVTAYKQAIRNNIHVAYTSCLTAKTSPDQIEYAINLCAQACSEIRPIMPQPFNNVLITKEELQTIAQAIPQPDWNFIFKELLKELTEKFSMYANDLAAADVVIEQSTIDLNHMNALENEALQNHVATNNLIASGSVYTVDKVEIKTKKSIKVIDNDPSWVLKIMSAFMASFNVCMPLITVKNYSGMTIKQMATALDKAGIEIKGIEYITTEK